MRVLVAPDGFTGTLTAPQAAEAIAAGWLAARPGDEVDLCPMSDGGPGFVEVLAAARPGGELLRVPTTGPLGAPTSAAVLLAADGTAYVESAAACGTALVPPRSRGPATALAATTAGVGTLLAAAREAGARRVVVGLGGSSTTDGGAGLLAALGAGDPGVLARGGGALAGVRADDLPGLAAVRRAWACVDLVVASDVDVPLLGEGGAARGFGPQKGADAAAVEQLEEALAAFARAAEGADAAARGVAGRPGAGAAGGLGHALMLLGATRCGGARAVAEAVDLGARVGAVAAAGGLVVTGEGSLDWQSLRGKVVAEVAALGRAGGVAVHAVAGQVHLAPGQAAGAGLAGAWAVAERPEDVPGALADPTGTLSARAQRLAASWGAWGVGAPER